GETLKAITFNLGLNALTSTTLTELSVSAPDLMTHLSSFDVILLQSGNPSPNIYEASSALTSVLVDAAKKNHTMAGKRWSKGLMDFTASTVHLPKTDSEQPSHPETLLLLVRTTKSRALKTLKCLAETYAPSVPMLGCLIRDPTTSSEIMFINVEDSKTGSVLTAGGRDLAGKEVGVMRRMYAGLCVHGKGKGESCQGLGVPAVFAGTWGDDAVGVRSNGTFAEAKAGLEAVEKEIVRKNQIGDKSFPHGWNEHFRVRALAPPEKRTGDATMLLYHDESVVGSMLGWIMGSKDVTIVNWPYWTNWRTGSISDFIILWSTEDASHPTSHSVTSSPSASPSSSTTSTTAQARHLAHIPPHSIMIDPFMSSKRCRYDGSDASTSKWCSSTRPACWSGDGVVPVGARFEGRRGGNVCAMTFGRGEEGVLSL
ncbi:hypothetical protein HDU67_000729, partial [Dinochytrium kinnereticum]